MTIGQYLDLATRKLVQTGIGTARLDTLVLLEDVTGIDRARLLAEPGTELSSAQKSQLEKLLRRRTRHEPLAYIRGKTEFYGREFLITPAVLEPRPESETMIELLKKVVRGELADRMSVSQNQLIRIADVGSGSGALGITAALEVPQVTVDLLDIDPRTLQVAKNNVDKFTLELTVVQSDLLLQASHDYTILLCNLPYVPDSYTINDAAGHEPRLAIFGGPDGLAVYRCLFEQITVRSSKPLYILTESLPPQHVLLQEIARGHGYSLRQTEDFIQVFQRSESPGSLAL